MNFEKIPNRAMAQQVILPVKWLCCIEFRRFEQKFTLSSCFLSMNAVKMTKYRVLTGLVLNKTRIAICQKQLHQSHFFWFLDYLHVQIHHLLQARLLSTSLNRLWHQSLHRNTKSYSQEPIEVLGAPQIRTCGGVS